MKTIRLITLDPGHFHAALVQKELHPGIARRCHVYAPLGPDVVAHLNRLSEFNNRPDHPTNWDVDLRASADYHTRFLREQPGNTVVLSGRNRPKIDRILSAVTNGLNVLADKPWVIEPADFVKLEQVFHEADLREVLAWDMMTERHDVASRLQRQLVRDRELFGNWLEGTADHPALTLDSVHHLKKTVAGRPLVRPWWWFDPGISGEAMTDVGTHLADVALWLICPNVAVDYRTEIAILDADRWPLLLSQEQFAEVTGLPDYPQELASHVAGSQLYYAGNNTVSFTLRGIHVRLGTFWDYESSGGDRHQAIAQGSNATVAIRQGETPGSVPEVFIAPRHSANFEPLAKVLESRCTKWQQQFPGVAVEPRTGEFQIVIPHTLRTGHESHFLAVLDEFVGYLQTLRSVPSWERPNLLAKYSITTQAVALARKKRPF